MINPRIVQILSPEVTYAILALRLLIARAANQDSLAWWEDGVFTAAAGYALDRLFPVAPPLAARSLALQAALTRHQAAVGEAYRPVLHLYRLAVDNVDCLALRFAPLLPVSVPAEPILTLAALREQLLALTGTPGVYKVETLTHTRALLVTIPPPPAGMDPLLHRARSLAWAYLEGAPGQPVFPFILE